MSNEIVTASNAKPKQAVNAKPALYAIYFPILREIAHKHGYACAIHGSLSRDLDLICVGWQERVTDHKTVLAEMGEAIGYNWVDTMNIAGHWEIKSRGRIGYALRCGGDCIIDISFIGHD